MKTEFSPPQADTSGPRNDYGRIRVDNGDTPTAYLERFEAAMERAFLGAFHQAEKRGYLA